MIHELTHSWFGNGVTSVSAAFFCTFADGTLGMLTLLTSGLTKAGQLMSNVYYCRLYTHLHTEAYLP